MQRRLCACENDTCDLFNVTATIRSLQTSKEDLQISSEAISIRPRAAPDANDNDTVARCEGSDDRVGNSMRTASCVPPLWAVTPASEDSRPRHKSNFKRPRDIDEADVGTIADPMSRKQLASTGVLHFQRCPQRCPQRIYRSAATKRVPCRSVTEKISGIIVREPSKRAYSTLTLIFLNCPIRQEQSTLAHCCGADTTLAQCCGTDTTLGLHRELTQPTLDYTKIETT